MTDDKPTPPLSDRDKMLAEYFDKMLAEYFARQLRKRIELARVRTPGGLARLFPGLGKRKP